MDVSIFKSMLSIGCVGTQPDSSKVVSHSFVGNHIEFTVQSFHGSGTHTVIFAPYIGYTFDKGVKAHCGCQKDKFFGYQYIRKNISPKIYCYGNIGKANQFPTIKNPSLDGIACHHILSCAQYIVNNPGILQEFSIYNQVRFYTAYATLF